MKVNFLDLKQQYLGIKKEIDTAIEQVLNKCAFAAGPFVKEFETNFSETLGIKYCVGVNSGTSALHAAILALDIGQGDEVIVPCNTFFATAEAVSLAGAVPVFVDCEEKYYNIDPNSLEKAITRKTKAIIAVHLYGQPAMLDEISRIAVKHNLILIEDCAQAHLAKYKNEFVGGRGRVGCFSFYPGKNLGAYGEAGAITTNDEELYKKMMALRDHGMSQKYHHDYIGHNYRMEGLQGAILNVKLKYLKKWTSARQACAAKYNARLSKIPQLKLPQVMPGVEHVYHLYVVRTQKREELINYLTEREIFTGIHYPIPCHLQKAYGFLGYKPGSLKIGEEYSTQVLSLPMHENLTEQEIDFVGQNIEGFFRSNHR